MTNRPLEGKSLRLLKLYTLFQSGMVVNKAQVAMEFQVTERSIQRDIDDLRCYLADHAPTHEIIYDARAKGYRLTETDETLFTNSETLAVCKILLESRSMVKEEMMPILDKLIGNCVPERDKKIVKEFINNEKCHYITPHHQQRILPGMWKIGQAIQRHQLMEIIYEHVRGPKLVTRCIAPVGLMFSGYYFYLIAFLWQVDAESAEGQDQGLSPTIYRLDRIRQFTVLEEHFSAPYRDQLEEGDFRKRVQFMYGGKLERINFRYTGIELETVLDRLPTAQVISEDDNGWIISAEAFGKGLDLWLQSHGDMVEKVE